MRYRFHEYENSLSSFIIVLNIIWHSPLPVQDLPENNGSWYKDADKGKLHLGGGRGYSIVNQKSRVQTWE